MLKLLHQEGSCRMNAGPCISNDRMVDLSNSDPEYGNMFSNLK